MIKFLSTCLIVLMLAACGGETAVSPTTTPSPAPTNTTIPTSTPIPEPTNTPIPEPTATATPVPLSQEEANDLLIEAIKVNDLDEVLRILSQGADIETVEPFQSSTPLTLASLMGHTEIVIELIAAGANVNAQNKQESTPLILAAREGHTEIILLLIDAGVDIEHQDDTQWKQNALHWAAREGHTTAVKALLDAGADINALEDTQSTALMYAAYFNDHTDIVALLIERNANLDLEDQGEQTALYWARNRGNSEIAAMIEAAGGAE